jgi:SOS-response transcriptional repressor LexA
MNRQRGVTFIGMIFVAAAIIFVAIIALKLIPPYIEYASIRSQFREIARGPDTRGASPAEVRAAFDRRAQIDNIKAITSQDIDVAQEGDGVSLNAAYSVRVPLMGNVSACLDFVVTSD